ncbi:hypothetical protein H7Y63_00625 [Polaromonas sp.]|nr:hypothetical protein [Candidatus Saccharibacteria bacterium]
MKVLSKSQLKDIALEVLGWILVLIGLAALVLPGPGLLALFAGLALLANRYTWAERRLEPIKKAALKGAADSVANVPRIMASALGALILMALGIIWGLKPAVPSWWPLADKFWLIGGWGTGSTLIGSGIIAAAMIVYSYVKLRPGRQS